MNNKKVIITIIIATLLALIAANVLFRKTSGNKLPQVQQEENVINTDFDTQESIEKVEPRANISDTDKEVSQAEKKNSTNSTAKISKSSKTEAASKKQVIEKHETQSVEVKEAEIQKSEQISEPALYVDENGNVNVLKEFPNKSIYKYTYTPVRFRGKGK